MLPFPKEWISQAIRINSVTDRSNGEMVRFLSPLLQESGLHIHEHRVVENGETFTNLLAFNRGLDAPNALWLNTHLDTVSAGDRARWTQSENNDPWQATFKGDRVYGLGAADVKIDFLCKLWAARTVRPEHPIVLVGTYGEERGLVGITELLKVSKVHPRWVLVGEPSDLELIYAHKGHLIGTIVVPLDPPKGELFDGNWDGVAAHSSTPNLGKNAIQAAFKEIAKKGYGVTRLDGGVGSNTVPESARAELCHKAGPNTKKLLKLVSNLEKIATGLKKTVDRRFTPSTSTLSFNWAKSAEHELTLTFDMRTLPAVDIAKLKAKVEKAAPAGTRWVSITTDSPLRGEKDSELMVAASAALKKCGVKPVQKTKASSTEAAVYNQYGAQAIVFGPGVSIGNVHKPNEHNLLSQIKVATEFYRRMLERPLA